MLRRLLRRPTGGLVGSGDFAPVWHAGKQPAVLALHGFGGTPFEVASVVDVARALGLATHAPLLPGHGTHARDLAQTRYADWLGGGEAALDKLTETRPSRVVATGLSMGSVVAFELAARHPEHVIAVVAIANALWLSSPFPALALRAAERSRLPDFGMPKWESNIADVEARRTQVTYDVQPVHAAISLQRAGERVRGLLSKVRCPVLLLHGALDRVCPVDNAWRAAALLGTRDVRVIVLPRSAHIATRDHDRDVLKQEVAGFLRRFDDATT